MSEEDKSSKTEEPTEKKLSDQRKKGNVPSSKEVGTMVSIFSLMIIVVFVMPTAGPDFAMALGQMFEVAGTAEIATGREGLEDAGDLVGGLVNSVLVILGPVFLMMMLAAVFGVLIQGETVVTTERIKPKWSNISPVSGIKKIVSVNNLVEFGKSILKVAVVATIGFFVVTGAVGAIWTGELFVPENLPGYLRANAGKTFLWCAAFLVPVSIFDLIYKRMDWIKKNRMSLKEIKDEHKDSEGDPHMKAKRNEKRQEMSRKRMSQTVPTATVILTNPTHFAVALRYEKGFDDVPVCVAKGIDSRALKIREIAKEHDIPIIENRPLARALHATVEVDGVVPVDHWQAVAEIIAFVMDLRNKIPSKPPEGSELRDD
jgi:flagellar biosynthesis protein FlhB